MRFIFLLIVLLSTLLSPYASAAATKGPDSIALVTNRLVLTAKTDLLQQAASAQQMVLTELHAAELSDQQLLQAISQHSFVLIDMPRATDFERMRQRLAPFMRQLPEQQLWVGRTEQHASGLAAQDAEQLWLYYRHGGAENFRNFFRYLSHLQQPEKLAELPSPQLLPDTGAYHPRYPAGFTASIEQMLQFLQPGPNQGVVAVGFHARYLESAAMQHIDAVVNSLEQRGLIALPVFYTLGPEADLTALLKDRVHVLLHLQPVYHNGLLAHLEQLRIPVLQGIGWWQGDEQHWRDDPVGISLAGTPLYLALPEQNGLMDPLILWAEHEGVIQPIPAQIEAMTAKAANLIRLQQQQSNFAVMLYNYPPGERNISASFMNVPRSLANLSTLWASQGIAIAPFSEQEAIATLTQVLTGIKQPEQLPALLADELAAALPLTDYLAWYQQLRAPVRQRIEAYWGAPTQSQYLVETAQGPAFVIPHWRRGPALFMAQPPRGEPGQDRERQLYHDARIPASHYYLASYLWVRQYSGAGALVHFGTHGTQEWLPGKERGLSVDDDPLLALGDIPVIYPYIVDNVGEATQAKRRGRAQIISHQTPPFRPSGLHGQLVEMHQLIHQYEQLEPGDVRDFTAERLINQVLADPILKDIGWDEASIRADFDSFFDAIHDYLHELAAMAQPLGLHTFADAGQHEQRLTTVLQMLGNDFLAALQIDEPDELYADDYSSLSQTLPYRWLAQVLNGQATTPALPDWQQKALEFDALLQASQELHGLNTGLAGGYVSPSVGGDPLRVLDSLPTGRNLYGFDPSRVPTREAWQAGKAAVTDLLTMHQQKHGDYPTKLAFSLWAVEAMRHGGVLESQAFYAMGVEPEWDPAGRVVGYRVLSADELGRPRLDVVLSATGLYRDQFPNVMAHFAKAAAELSQLNEANNPIFHNTARLQQQLEAEGMDAGEAFYLASTRVFGSPTGVYGTGLEDSVAASDSWENDDKLAELYLSRMSYAFGADPERWGQGADTSALYAEQLKGVDAALLARSSNLYGMLTTDDPFQYLGGLDLAVRYLTGQSPSLYIANQRQPGQSRIEPAARFLATELSTRSFHPGWIQAMQQEGFAGALNLQDMMANFWGWQVVSPDIVRDDQWQRFHDVYVMDSLELDIHQWFSEHAPEAQVKMMERMLEAVRKDYWQADETTLTELLTAYLERLNELGQQPVHDKLADFVQQQAAGFGLDALLGQGEAGNPIVQGQQLVQQNTSAAPTEHSWYWLPLLLLLPLLYGIYRQLSQHPRRL